MRIRTLVRREIFERKKQLITSFIAIFLGITAIISIKNITFYSEKAVAGQLDALGANILILPKSASVQDYYSADMQDEDFPEEYVDRLIMSDLQGLDNLSPKLSVAVAVGDRNYTLTGILPKQEFQAKTMWQGAGIFSRPEGCGIVVDVPLGNDQAQKEAQARKRIIETLGYDEVLLGADVAATSGIKENDNLQLMGKQFSVIAILPQTGTVDDSRIFAHLHTVQKMTGKGSVVNAIEIVGCCSQISKGLVQKINKLLPEAKVVTITQVVDTQIKTNRLMSCLSMIFLIIIVLVGGASIANYMYANVFERRREIGTLMALGAGFSLILKIFLLKALILGFTGGIGGYLLGTVLAVTLGPRLAGVPIMPLPILLVWATGISVAVAFIASYFPARSASKLDPCTTLQEI
ncbi:MAG TPA: FtsX-like permease family protein [Patescibacteria group bacterium]|nr:FtsX-like permease family protein [Patescibacteria group bacterium]